MLSKRLVTATVILLSTSAFCSRLEADFTAFAISNQGTDEISPFTDGNTVVWQDKRSGNWDIWGVSIDKNANPIFGTPLSIYSGAGDQTKPVVSDNYYAWVDAASANRKIVARTLTPGGYYDAVPSENNNNPRDRPRISKGVLLWEEPILNSQVFGYSLKTGVKLSFGTATSDAKELQPNLNGKYGVWQLRHLSNANNIAVCTLSNNTTTVLQSPQPRSLEYPGVSNDIVVWREMWQTSGAFHVVIYGYNLQSNNQFLICPEFVSPYFVSGIPAISNNLVVWASWNGVDNDISGYNLHNQTTFPICTAAGEQRNPSIGDNIVVWEDHRNGNWDIYGTVVSEPNTIIFLAFGGVAMLLTCRRKIIFHRKTKPSPSQGG